MMDNGWALEEDDTGRKYFTHPTYRGKRYNVHIHHLKNGKTIMLPLVSQDEDLQKQAVELIESIGPDSTFFGVAEALRLLVEMLDDKFLQNLPASPHHVIMKEGINELRRGRFDHALKHWIDALKKEREYREVARKACVAVFKFLGEDSEVTRQYRPAFSSAFYS